MEKGKISRINSEVNLNNFTTFDSLSDAKQIEVMKTWNRSQWVKFRMRNTMTEAEVFNPIFQMIEENDD